MTDEYFVEDWMDEPPSNPRRVSSRVGSRQVGDTVAAVLAAADHRQAVEVRKLIKQIRSSKRALELLTRTERETIEGVLEAVEFELDHLSDDATVTFDALAKAPFAAPAVTARLQAIAARVGAADLPATPLAGWMALVNEVEADHTRELADRVIDVIEARKPVEAQKEALANLKEASVGVNTGPDLRPRTVASMVDTWQRAPSTGMRLSSGYPTLDAVLTGPGDKPGMVAPGEGVLILGATGTGKSSMAYALVRAMAADLHRRDSESLVLLLHTEEETFTKAKAIGLLPGQPWHRLAPQVVIENVGSSRTQIAAEFYKAVAWAVHRAEATGRHPSEFAPRVVFLDYIQAIREPREDENTAVIRTAELLLRGIQACNPYELAKYSNLDFTEFTGMPWPEELADHRVATVTFAQLRKSGNDAAIFYDPANRRHSLAKFALVGVDGAPVWEVRPGDFALFTKEDIYGSSRPLQNATTVLLLHRSRPLKNPVVSKDAFGYSHLADTRARLIVDKARTGQQALYVPMAFDVMPEGFRAQYYDAVAERALAEGRIVVAEEMYRRPGDPMLPVVEARKPFDGLAY